MYASTELNALYVMLSRYATENGKKINVSYDEANNKISFGSKTVNFDFATQSYVVSDGSKTEAFSEMETCLIHLTK